MMTVRIGFSATKVVNGETIADYATEAANNNTAIGKMINAANELLKRHKIRGINGVIGNYDANLVGDACHRIFNGAQDADTGYGFIISRQYFETAKLL